LILLLLFVALALGVSFLCSTLEAALLSTRNSTLADQESRGMKGSGLLLHLKRKRVDDALSAILVLNTVANTLGATLAGAQAARVFGRAWVGVFSGVLTFLILIFSEIIPKTLGAVYSRQLAPLVGWTLHYLTRAMAPALVLSRAMTRLLTRGRQASFSRRELAATISSASQEGVISREESAMLENLLRFQEVRIQDVMTPRTVAFMLPDDATVEDLLANREAEAFSRVPLYRGDRDNVVGYILQRQVLKGSAAGLDPKTPLRQLMRPISFIPEVATLGTAMRQILERREPLAMAIDEHGGVAGLVTLEDLTETLLGVEIVDESDRIVDQRQAAVQLRDLRLEHMLRRRKAHIDHSENKGQAVEPRDSV
jgi:CBS domain containing-hemolysin-like protein